MAWDKGFNFRGSAGYVTDGANETYVTSDAYPTTRNGVTFGWTAGGADAGDRSLTNAVELAGRNETVNTGTQSVFRIDLPAAGDYDIRLANGSPSANQDAQYLEIFDGATSVLVNDNRGHSNAVNEFYDATNVKRTAAAWPGSNLPRRVTFSGTVLTLKLGTPASDINSTDIAHLFLSQVVGGSPQTASPSPATSSWVAKAAVIVLGALIAHPAPAIATTVAKAPAVTLGGVAANPASAISTWAARGPAIALGGVTALPAPAISTWVARSATATSGSAPQTASPAPAVSAWVARSPGVALGGLSRVPAPAVANWVVRDAMTFSGTVVLATSPTSVTLSPSRSSVSLPTGRQTVTLASGRSTVTLAPSRSTVTLD